MPNNKKEPYESKYLNVDLYAETAFKEIWNFGDHPLITDVYETEHGYMMFGDNGGDVLAVGHLDTVQQDKHVYVEGNNLYSPQLDDRLGVYLLLEVLPNYGFNCDVLLTDSEETGNSTAQFFRPHKQYNWMIEIDRSGALDAALYQYFNPKTEKLLKEVGIKASKGSFTDIAYLDHVGVVGINFSCAYHNNHSMEAYCVLPDLDDQMDRVIEFYHKHKDTFMKNEEHYPDYGYKPATTYKSYRSYSYSDYLSKRGYYKQESVLDDPSCYICHSELCEGLEECVWCGLKFHRNMLVKSFGLCSQCLKTTIGVSDKEIKVVLDSKDDEKTWTLMNDIYYTIIEQGVTNE